MKIITMSALIVALSSGAAFADRHGGGGGGGGFHGGGGGHATVVHNGGGGGGTRWSGGVSVRSEPRLEHRYNGGGYNRGYVGGGYRYDRRPIYVGRPIIRERYFDYRFRPRIIVENYAPMAGYYWVPGGWQWNGYEWLWQPGHYQPDAAYDNDVYVE